MMPVLRRNTQVAIFIYIIAEIIAKIAGFVEIFINNIMGYGNKRQEILDMLRIKVDQRYRGAIPGVLKTYRKQWNDTVKVFDQKP